MYLTFNTRQNNFYLPFSLLCECLDSLPTIENEAYIQRAGCILCEEDIHMDVNIENHA